MRIPYLRRLSLATSVVLIAGSALGTLIAFSDQPASAAGPCGSAYPYADFGGRTDPNGFYAPDMRSYVAACVNASGNDLARTEKGPNGQVGTFGSPGTWDATASALGFQIITLAQVGTVAQLHSGETAPLYDDSGNPTGTLTGGDIVGYVDQVYSNGQALVRTYDSSQHQIRSFRMTAPRYLVLSGGKGIRNGGIGSPSPKPTKKPSPSPSPKPTKKPSASPTATPTPTPSASPTDTPIASPSASVSAPPLANLTNKKSQTLASKYGKAIGIGGVVVALLLGVVVVAAARRTDDTGD